MSAEGMRAIAQEQVGWIEAEKRRMERAGLLKMLVVTGQALAMHGAPPEVLEPLRAAFRWVQSQKA